MKILEILEIFKDSEMPLLFCDYYAHLVNKQKYEEDIISAYDRMVKFGNINILTETLKIDFAQWELMKRLTSNIEINAEKNIRRGNNPNGSPWTQYDIDDSCLKGNDEAFYRIDINKEGYYLSLRQYLKYDTEEFMKKVGINDKDILYNEKMKRLYIYRECFEKSVKGLNKDIEIYISKRGAYESEIGSFRLNSIENLLWLEKNLSTVTNRFLQLVKQS